MPWTPAPIPTVPSSERVVGYDMTADTTAVVPFTVWGTETDLNVYLDGVQIYNFVLFSPSGLTPPTPITDGVLTFPYAITGHLIIDGDRMPRRTSNITEGGDTARLRNIDTNTIFATLVEVARALRRTLHLSPSELDDVGYFDARQHLIKNLADPIDPQDAVNLRTAQALLGDGDGDGSGGIPTVVDVIAASPLNVRIPDPTLISGNLVIDGMIIEDQEKIFLPNETSQVNNGVWLFTAGTGLLSRPADYASGATIRQPFYVTVESGDTLGGATFELQSPAAAVVDTDATVWINSESGSGNLEANQGTFGPTNPGLRSRPATRRLLSVFDIQPYDPSLSDIEFPQTIFNNLSKIPRVSDYIRDSLPWNVASAIGDLLKTTNVIIFDCTVHLNSEIPGPLSGKKFIFMGSGEAGPCRVVMTGVGASFLDLTDVHDFVTEGFCRVHYPIRATAAVKAIKGVGFSRVRFDSLYFSGVDHGINVSGTIDGLQIREIGVENSGTDTAFTIASGSASGSLKTIIGRVTGRQTYQTDPAAGAAFTYTAWTMANVVNLNGTQTANRTITGSLTNASQDYTATFVHNAAGGFNYNVMGLKTIVNGQSATVKINNGAWVLAG